MIQVQSKEDLTNEFILEIDDVLFIQTMAYKTFGNKQLFVNKIRDLMVRYKMMNNIIQLIQL